MTPHDHAPGITWLAERAGIPPEELLRDPVRLFQQLAAATRETIELTAGTVSPDPYVRQEACERAEQLRSRLTAGPSTGQRFGAAVAQAMRDQAERLRAAT